MTMELCAMNSPPEPTPPPVDAALAAYVEQRIDERLGNERASLLAAKREFIERLIELRLTTVRFEDGLHRLAAIMELNQRQSQTVIDLPKRQRRP
jgi:hypothetical protein